MIESTGNPLRDLELAIEKEGEIFKRRRMAEELQKLADQVPAVSPPHESSTSPRPSPGDETDESHGRGKP